MPTVPRSLELELTNRCQLTCDALCFVQAGPTKGHGTMSAGEWRNVITQASALGVQRIKLIGGEPTLHPHFGELLEHALAEGLHVTVHSNLVRIRKEHWPLFERPCVTLATSYYADTSEEHDAVTHRTGSHAATRDNIIEAHRRGIRVRVNIVDVHGGQQATRAHEELTALGITDIGIDHVRAIGNAARAALPSTSELCGRCAHGVAAVLSDGVVTPCVMGRFLPAGQVKGRTLHDVFTSPAWHAVAASIPSGRFGPCGPDCGPNDDSQGGGGTCGPAADAVPPSAS
ncbi:radical SAM protein [Streptomyces sp. NBRC 110465]|uniref:radical SAM protein n=1 Tax=Streptomyces sp. NBRC 110465 TaxID=1897621 RepID=UPI001F16C114|nr:radical SAM protein [Streptomyces sp. NBRC 110465]